MRTFNVKRFIVITLGLAVMSLGLHFFLIPAKLATGGLTGLAMLVHELFPNISIGLVMLLGNIVLFLLALWLIGRDFGGYTIYSSLMLSVMIGLLERFVPMSQPLVDDVLLNLFYGTLIPAIGMGIIFYQNSSTGGTDILAKLIHRYFHLDIGKALMLVDFLIVLFAIKIFGLSNGLYALIGVMFNATVIDTVIAGFNSRLYTIIITDAHREINHYIIRELDRGSTLYLAEGGFSGSAKKAVHVMINKREYIRLKQFVKQVDPHALMSIHFVHEVIGEGFHTFEE